MDKYYKISPFIKWAGGKKQLLPELIDLVPQKYNRYFEPFIGGGALLMELQPNKVIINDINSELINTYKHIKENVYDLIKELEEIDKNHLDSEDPKEFYYAMREFYNNKILEKQHDIKMASLFIYLNKHCFNGLYRVNSKGLFNVPYNNSNCASFSEINLIQLSSFLQNVEIENNDFEDVCVKAKKNDFVFFDSPYAPLNETSFDSYTKMGFDKSDHIRLANLFKKLSKKGCFCVLTNHDTELINSLYADFNIKQINVKRSINANGTKRKGKEIIVTNF